MKYTQPQQNRFGRILGFWDHKDVSSLGIVNTERTQWGIGGDCILKKEKIWNRQIFSRLKNEGFDGVQVTGSEDGGEGTGGGLEELWRWRF